MPYKKIDDLYIWSSSDIKNYLVFTIQNNEVKKIRWHEEREPKYKNTIVWNVKYE